MDKPKDGGPAFPQPNHVIDTDRGREEARGWMEDSGMSLRDWFAGKALAGEMASTSTAESVEATARAAERSGTTVEMRIAINCYALADAMITARGMEVAS